MFWCFFGDGGIFVVFVIKKFVANVKDFCVSVKTSFWSGSVVGVRAV